MLPLRVLNKPELLQRFWNFEVYDAEFYCSVSFIKMRSFGSTSVGAMRYFLSLDLSVVSELSYLCIVSGLI